MKAFAKAIAAIMLMTTVFFAAGCSKDPDNSDNTNNNTNPVVNNSKPKVGTVEITDVTSTSVTCVAKVLAEGESVITERGVCWSITGTPKITGPHCVVEGGVGEFSCEITGLEPGASYSMCGYAINSFGIAYGATTRFTTLTDQPSSVSPSIAVLAGDGFAQDGDVVYMGDEVYIGFVMSSNPDTHQELSSLDITINEEIVDWIDLSGLFEYTYAISLYFENEREMFPVTINATVSDVAGETATSTITLNLVETIYLEVYPFEWYRDGGNSGSGLEEFGLEWTHNSKEVFARINPLDGVLLFQFDPSVWWQVNTEAEKEALFYEALETQNPMAEYANVSVYASADYDDVLGTILPDGSMRLIHVTHCMVYMDNLIHVIISGDTK